MGMPPFALPLVFKDLYTQAQASYSVIPQAPSEKPRKKKNAEGIICISVLTGKEDCLEKQKEQQLLMHYCVRTAAQHPDRLKLVHAA